MIKKGLGKGTKLAKADIMGALGYRGRPLRHYMWSEIIKAHEKRSRDLALLSTTLQRYHCYFRQILGLR